MSRDYHFRFSQMLDGEQSESPQSASGTHHQTSVQRQLETTKHSQDSTVGFHYHDMQPPLPPYNHRQHLTPASNNSQQIHVIQLGGGSNHKRKEPYSSESPQSTTVVQANRTSYQHESNESSLVEGFTLHMQSRHPTAVTDTKIQQKLISQPKHPQLDVATWQEKILSKMLKNIQKLRRLTLARVFKLLQNQSEQANRMILMFTNHCATMIQKHFRRYITQKYYRHYVRCVSRMKQLVEAMCLGWKVRRIFKTRTICRMVEEIRKKEQEKKLKDMRIQKREFATEISKMLRSAKWLDQLRAARGNNLKPSKFRFLKTVANPVSNPNPMTDIEPNTQPSAKKTLQNKASFNEDMPLPTHANANKAPLVNLQEVPIKATSGGAQYNFNDDAAFDIATNSSVPEKTKKPTTKKPPQKKKVVKLSHPQDELLAKSAKESEARKQYIQPVIGLPQIAGDTDPLDMSEKQWIEAPTAIQAVQRYSSDAEDGKQGDDRKKFLKRRTKYDPRKAIEEERQRKLQAPTQQTKQIREPPSKSRSRSTDKTVQHQRRPTGQPPLAVRHKNLANISNEQESNITIKRPPLAKLDGSRPVVAFNTVRSPTHQLPRQKHIPLEQLESTYESAYLNKKHSLLAQCEKLARKSRKISYPIPSVRQVSDIYRRFSLATFEVPLRSIQGTQTLLQQQYRCMLNM